LSQHSPSQHNTTREKGEGAQTGGCLEIAEREGNTKRKELVFLIIGSPTPHRVKLFLAMKRFTIFKKEEAREEKNCIPSDE
jgi:hypothetical protein